MADEMPQVEVQESTANAPAQETPADAETDWKAEARKWEDRAKANRDEANALKAQLAEASDSRTDLEKALARIGKLEAKNSELEHSALVSEVAQAKGVKPSLLHGATRAELEANADDLLAWQSEQAKKPAAPLLGRQPSQEPKNAAEAENRAFLRRITGKE
ncbi:MAG: hypothetical protein MSC53_04360 [Arcanobacterium sp.]|nr:hypothetical protein [Arcanobacterium sp.]